MMNLLTSGKDILTVEVSHISTFGVWLLTPRKEFFMSYEDFPWFKNQTIDAIINVEEILAGHFYWKNIDVELTEKMIENPKDFPLIAKI